MKNFTTEIEKLGYKLSVSFYELSTNMKLDLEWFKRYGIEEDRIDLFEHKVQKFQFFLQDITLYTSLTEKEVKRRKNRKDLRMSIRKVLLTMMFAWPEGHPMSEIYSFSSFSKMNDFELANSARIILLVAHNHKEMLQHFGLKDEFLYQLSVQIAKLTAIHSELEMLKRENKIRTLIIQQKAVELIKEAKIYSQIGRSIWRTKDKEQYSKYRLPYHTVKKLMENDVGFYLHPNPY